ncbi:Phospholipase D/Transphosphatidylase [Venturia nashicola]|uniref:Phospholipase D/Transphosphatidylase n=1 Tax=Venturia nashicola TaxID=86259 RepID=A0A4Z1NVB2_9PEZI|nr:Phospholipase D/Transphosphatidylase [Venturia nashicola]
MQPFSVDNELVGRWWDAMVKNTAENQHEDPGYYANKPDVLIAEAKVNSFIIGNGDDIFGNMQASIEAAKSEVTIITCFWARSSSLNKLSTSLRRLSNKVVESNRPKVRVFIGFSSLSKLQMLFHTSSLHGQDHPPATWPTKLGLPSVDELPGLDIQIKSIFVRPFCVMHPKFIIIDRQMVWLPSCNVSWETWFEGCILLSGPIVQPFLDFWHQFWVRDGNQTAIGWDSSQPPLIQGPLPLDRALFGAAHGIVDLQDMPVIESVFLPSPNHMNPRFRLPFQQAAAPPPTPLNLFILELFNSATESIYIQTPNLTSPPLIDAILEALDRGISVHIVTSKRLMIIEQLVLAGTTTSRCVTGLIKRYQHIVKARRSSVDEETGLMPIGKLRIEYYEPKSTGGREEGEPLQSHLKITIADHKWVVLGSGNMDRPSWYTSQELGVALHSQDLCQRIRETVDHALEERKRLVFDGVNLNN